MRKTSQRHCGCQFPISCSSPWAVSSPSVLRGPINAPMAVSWGAGLWEDAERHLWPLPIGCQRRPQEVITGNMSLFMSWLIPRIDANLQHPPTAWRSVRRGRHLQWPRKRVLPGQHGDLPVKAHERTDSLMPLASWKEAGLSEGIGFKPERHPLGRNADRMWGIPETLGDKIRDKDSIPNGARPCSLMPSPL